MSAQRDDEQVLVIVKPGESAFTEKQIQALRHHVLSLKEGTDRVEFNGDFYDLSTEERSGQKMIFATLKEADEQVPSIVQPGDLVSWKKDA